jgi:hypothetical protein
MSSRLRYLRVSGIKKFGVGLGWRPTRRMVIYVSSRELRRRAIKLPTDWSSGVGFDMTVGPLAMLVAGGFDEAPQHVRILAISFPCLGCSTRLSHPVSADVPYRQYGDPRRIGGYRGFRCRYASERQFIKSGPFSRLLLTQPGYPSTIYTTRMFRPQILVAMCKRLLTEVSDTLRLRLQRRNPSALC